MNTQQFTITNSHIEWTGRKVTGAHNGTIDIKNGILEFSNNLLSHAHFTIDIRSIRILDVTDPATNAQFAGHLASDDFFSTEKHPEAFFKLTLAEPRGNGSYHLTGTLTIKDITHDIDFDAQVNHTGHTVTASGKITIDRTWYDMKFRSGNFFKDLGDTLIYNNFDLDVNITAQA